ncbi:hypothetical protein [Streptomyces sp. NPDC002520]
MSTTRRRLGTGPVPSPRTTPETTPSPRLLPIERIGAGPLLGEVEHQDVALPRGRRTLGPGGGEGGRGQQVGA